jgi:hypothetical protein
MGRGPMRTSAGEVECLPRCRGRGPGGRCHEVPVRGRAPAAAGLLLAGRGAGRVAPERPRVVFPHLDALQPPPAGRCTATSAAAGVGGGGGQSSPPLACSCWLLCPHTSPPPDTDSGGSPRPRHAWSRRARGWVTQVCALARGHAWAGSHCEGRATHASAKLPAFTSPGRMSVRGGSMLNFSYLRADGGAGALVRRGGMQQSPHPARLQLLLPAWRLPPGGGVQQDELLIPPRCETRCSAQLLQASARPCDPPWQGGQPRPGRHHDVWRRSLVASVVGGALAASVVVAPRAVVAVALVPALVPILPPAALVAAFVPVLAPPLIAPLVPPVVAALVAAVRGVPAAAVRAGGRAASRPMQTARPPPGGHCATAAGGRPGPAVPAPCSPPARPAGQPTCRLGPCACGRGTRCHV